MQHPRHAFRDAFLAARDRREITPAQVLIGWAMFNCGIATPTHAFLAQRARCHVRTVQRALTRFRKLGLLTWTRIVLRTLGWTAQLANEYHLNGKADVDYRVIRRHEFVQPPPGFAGPVLNPPALTPELAAIRERRQATLAAEWAARRPQIGRLAR